jgi:hypothetical protein
MTIRTFEVWGWSRTLIYGAGATSFLAAAVLLINADTPEYSTVAKLPSLLGVVAWCYAGWRLHGMRERYAASIVFVTYQGVSVHVVDPVGKPLTGPARFWVEAVAIEIRKRIDEVAAFWSREPNAAFYSANDRASLIDDYLNGTHIEIVVTDEPIVNRRHAIKAAGLAYPKRLIVSLQPGELTMGYPARFWNILEHETGHACLDALGVPQERHHVEMQAAGWGAA